MGKYDGTKFRARGIYKPTGRDSFLTTVWRDTAKEAQADIAMFGHNHINTRVVTGNPAELRNLFDQRRKR